MIECARKDSTFINIASSNNGNDISASLPLFQYFLQEKIDFLYILLSFSHHSYYHIHPMLTDGTTLLYVMFASKYNESIE